MNFNEKKILSRKLTLEALKKYRGLFNKSPDDQSLELYADMLCEKYEFKQVTWALTEFVKKGSPFFPSCGEIFALLSHPEERKEDLAPMIVSEMLKALRAYGQYDEVRMLESVSENARLAFKALGNTMDIRLSENIETTKAQLERLVKGVLASKEHQIKREELAKIGIHQNVIQIGSRAPMKSLDFSEFERGPA